MTETSALTPEVLDKWALTTYPAGGHGEKLTPATVAAVLESISHGAPISVSCQAAGLASKTVFNWRRRAESDDPDAAPYREFVELLEQARAAAEADNVRVIKTAAKTNWTAAAWLLERAYPERWGRRDAVHTSGDVQHRVVFEFVGQKRLGQGDDGDSDQDDES